MKYIPCKICANPATIIHDPKFRADYYLCSNCKFISLDPRGIVSPEKAVGLYNLHNNTLANQGYVRMFEEFIAKSIDPYDHGIKKALDFGCGPGPVLAALLEKKGFDVDIYDPYFAPDKHYQEKTYDLITATEVFEHLPDPKVTMDMLVKRLNSGGLLAIMTLFHDDDIEGFKKWWYRRDPTHISFFMPKTFQVLADLAGLKILMLDSTNSCVLQK